MKNGRDMQRASEHGELPEELDELALSTVTGGVFILRKLMPDVIVCYFPELDRDVYAPAP